MSIRTKANRRIETRDRGGRPNGFVVPIYSVHDGFVAPEQYPQQAYLTVVAPGTTKGPHLHMKRWGLFTCLSGNVKIVAKTDAGYEVHYSGEDHGYASVQLPAGSPAALVNEGKVPAFVLNLPSPSWHADDQDDHEVVGWDYPLP